jgi:hypothetical protein
MGELAGDDQLPDMALRVLGQVDHQSNHCGGQLFAADAARRCKQSWIKGSNHLLGFLQSFIYFVQQPQASAPWIHFVMDCIQLLRRELLAADVSSQTLNAPCDMAQMKTYWRKAVWS